MYTYTQDDFVIHVGPEPPSAPVPSTTPLAPVPSSTTPLAQVPSSTTPLAPVPSSTTPLAPVPSTITVLPVPSTSVSSFTSDVCRNINVY